MNQLYSRRRIVQWLAGASVAFWGARTWAAPAGSPPKRIVCMSWELTETLLALGYTPVGIPLPGWYRSTIAEPVLPEGVANTGLLFQPNFQVLLDLAPDLLMLTAGHAGLQPALARLAPTVILGDYMSSAQPYPALQQDTRQMARVLNASSRAEALIADTEQIVERVHQHLAAQPVLLALPTFVAEVVDEHYVRVYGPGSLFDAMLQKIGVSNAASLAGWSQTLAGFAMVPVQRLARAPIANLLLVTPISPEPLEALQHNPIWQALPGVRENRVALLPVIAPEGGLVSMQRFALAVEQALVQTANQEPAFV